MRVRYFVGLLSTCTVALLGAGSAIASTTTSFTFSGQTSSTGNAMGDSLSLTSGALTVTETAWWLNTTSPASGTQFQKAALDSYNGYGLGVCDPTEGAACGSPQHQITNNVGIDFVLLVFSAPVSLQSLVNNLGLLHYQDLGSGTVYQSANADLTYWTPTSLITTSVTYGSLGAGTNVANGCYAGYTNPAPCSLTDTVTGGASVTELLIAAEPGSNQNDAFKLASLTVGDTGTGIPGSAPEPATWAMMIGGLAVLQFGRRVLGATRRA